MRRRLVALLVLLTGATLVGAPASTAEDDGLQQVDVVTSSDDPALASPTGVALSPDGRFAYTADYGTGSVSSFRRDDRGRLTPADSLDVDGNVEYVAVSPDGANVYVVGTGTIAVIDVGRKGSLSPGPAVAVEDGPQLSTGYGVTVSADGRFVYASDASGAGAVNVFSRNRDTGALRFHSLFTGSASKGLAYPYVLALSVDGKQLYASQCGGDGASDLVVIRRNPRTGALSSPRYVAVGSPSESCSWGIGAGRRTVVVSAYEDDAAVSFTRSRTGRLKPADELSDASMHQAYYLARPGGGSTFYVEGYGSDSVARLTVAADGTLKLRGTITSPDFSGPFGSAADRRNLYVSGYDSSSIVAFRRR